jgi:hypothetical protein
MSWLDWNSMVNSRHGMTFSLKVEGRIPFMFEGWFGERKTQFNLWFSLNKEL